MLLGFLSLHASSQWLNIRLVAATHRNLLENTIVTSPTMLTRRLHCQSSARLVGGQGGLGEFENTWRFIATYETTSDNLQVNTCILSSTQVSTCI
jgi:hypothetical protein